MEKKKGLKQKKIPKIKPNGFNANNITKYWRDQKPPGTSGQFTDPEFPPNENSILAKDELGKYIDPEVIEAKSEKLTDVKKVEWKRIDDIFPKSVIFEEFIESSDIIQGSIGNCYFLSTISSLTEMPCLIYQIFRTKTKNNNGYFEIVMFIDGAWQVVVVDDYFVVDKGTKNFTYAKPNGLELWVVILEKAWAKVNGGYANTISGNPKDVMMAFTGYSVESVKHVGTEPEEIWERIVHADRRNYIMCTSTCTNLPNDDYVKVSLVRHHAYTLIGAKEGKFNGNRLQLVELRNPWGKTEWNGDYSEKSNLWTEEQKKFFGAEVVADDGCFFMPFKDFIHYFSESDICNVLYDGYVKNFEVKGNDVALPQVFNFYTDKPCQLNVSAIFRFWRFNRGIKKSIHPTSIIIGKYDKDGVISNVSASFDIDSDCHAAKELEKGFYVVWVFCNYNDCSEPKHDKYQIRFFCDNEFKLKEQKPDTNFCLVRDMLSASIKNEFAKEISEAKDGIYYKQSNSVAGSGIGAYYLTINNPNKCSTADCVNSCQNMSLLPPYDLPLNSAFKISCPSNGSVIVLSMRQNRQAFMCYIKPTRHTYNGANKDPVVDHSLDNYSIKDFLSSQFKKELNGQNFYDYHSASLDEASENMEFESIDANLVELESLTKENKKEVELIMEYPPHHSISETDLKWSITMYGTEGDFYLGQLNKAKQRHGRGYYYWVATDQYYVGYWREGKKDIKGTISIKGKISYIGDMKENNKEGEGKYYYPGGDHFEGGFLNNQMHGKGVYFWSNGCSWNGEFSNGKFNGKGTYRNKQGQEYPMEYKDSKVVK